MAALPVADDQSEAAGVARRLAGLGASRGAFQVLVNAAAQRQAAEPRDAVQWTPSGMIPLKPRPHLHASNDHGPASKPSATIA